MKLNPTNRYCLVHSLQEELQIKEKMLHGRMSPNAVNSIGSEEITVPEIKIKKWFDIKVLAKKRVTAHRREMSTTGGGQTTT